jgi:TetR/AcrR family transcriptional regulator, cholesterol catabolism regulator
VPKENEKREKICDIAAKLFVEKGFERTTIRDIADAGGFNSASLYYYFEDKEDILYDILIKIMDDSLEQLQEIKESNLSLKEKLYAAIQLHTRVYGTDPVKGSLIVFNQKSLIGEHWEELKGKQANYKEIVVSILDELKKQGVVGDLNTTVSAFVLFGMIQWAHLWYDPKGPVKPKELEKIFTRIFTEGIFKDQKQEVNE